LAALQAQVATPVGVAPVYNAVSASDTVPNPGGVTVLLVRNGSGASINVTLVGVGRMGHVTVPNQVIAVPAGQDRLISLDAALFNDANGLVTVQFSATATVTMAVINLP
jgi:hypothetical protein